MLYPLLTMVLVTAMLVGCQLSPSLEIDSSETDSPETDSSAIEQSAENIEEAPAAEVEAEVGEQTAEAAAAAAAEEPANVATDAEATQPATEEPATEKPAAEETAPQEATEAQTTEVQATAAEQSVPPPLSVAGLSSIAEVQWSANGQWLAVAGSVDGTQGALIIYLSDETATPAWQAPSPIPTEAASMVISSDSQRIAAISGSNNVTVWDINTGGAITNFAYAEFAPISSIAFSPTGDRLAVGGAVGGAGLIKVVELATQAEIATVPYDQPFMDLSFRPDGQHLSGSVGHSCGPGAAFTFTLDLAGDLSDFSWRRDVEIQHAQVGNKMLTVGGYGQRCQFYNGDIQIVDTATKAITGNVTRLAAQIEAHLSADGSTFALDDGSRMEVWRDAPLRRVRVLDPAAGKPMAVSPDGSMVAQVNGNLITFIGAGGPTEPAIRTDVDAPVRDVERFAELSPETVASHYQTMEIPDGLLSITKASQSDPTILTFVVDQAAIDKYLMAVYDFESIQNWQGARYIEVDVRNGPEHSPLMIQLRERHADGRQGDSWRGSRAVPPFSEMTVSLLLEAGKGFNPIPTAPAGDGVLDLDAIGTIELGVTSHHVMRGEMEILAIRLFD